MDSVEPRGAAHRASEQGGGVDSRASWRMAWLVLAILSVSYASPLLIVVGMRPMQEALGTDRSVLALAGSLVWIGTGSGGILMGWLADRIGLRRTVAIGAVMIAGGLALSSLGSIWALYVGHALLGFLGNGGVYPPLLVYVSRWFERRRGAAIALISSGQYVAGVLWPAFFERGMTMFGWQAVMLVFGVFALGFILPATYFLKEPPKPPPVLARHATSASGERPRVAGFSPNVAQALLCVAGFFCCIPMSIPSAHIVAFCGDIGIKPTHGAAMLSVMLGCAFLARQAWGSLADRIGGLRTVMAGSACQAVAIALFLLTQDEAGLFVVSAVFGLGFAGIIPSYSVAVRDLFPASEASWRMPLTLFTAMSGMAFGSWFAGALYDHFGYYAPAFGIGVIFNLLNLILISFLVWRTGGTGRTLVWPTARSVA
jgi:MFS family permease